MKTLLAHSLQGQEVKKLRDSDTNAGRTATGRISKQQSSARTGICSIMEQWEKKILQVEQ